MNLDADETKSTFTSKINIAQAASLFVALAPQMSDAIGASLSPDLALKIVAILNVLTIILRTFFPSRPLAMSGPLTLK